MTDASSNDFDDLHSLQRSTILRVYNYYRILISFLFLWLFVNENFHGLVGSTNPELFQDTIIVYLMANIIIGLALPLFISDQFISKTAPSFVILTLDIIGLSLLIAASGGVASGLGNFLIFTVAFGGGLIYGRISTVLPAIAFILTIYTEFYLFFLEKNEAQSFFQAGVLGIVYFVANIFFQTLSQQLRRRENEIYTLEQINKIVVEQMRAGVVVASHSGKVKLINAAARQLLSSKYSPQAEIEVLPKRLLQKIAEVEYHGAIESFIFHTENDSPNLLATYSKVSSPDPNLDTLIFLEDSTEAHKQAQQLKLAALGRLSASIAHEIRNPLGAISHAAQLLGESNELNKGDQRLSDIIQNHCIRMNNVIENVLQMSRRKTAEPKIIKLNQWLKDFIQEFSAGYNDEIEILVDLQGPKTIEIEFDPLHLSQILGNLCQNGLRYSKKKTGSSKIVIKSKFDSTARNLDIIDFGEGVDEELIPNLFEPFYTTEVSGTGLGLYLSNELCEANNARLSYSRTPEGGSQFRISLVHSPLQSLVSSTARN